MSIYKVKVCNHKYGNPAMISWAYQLYGPCKRFSQPHKIYAQNGFATELDARYAAKKMAEEFEIARKEQEEFVQISNEYDLEI